MILEAPNKTVVYAIEKAIKEYRKFGYNNIKKVTDGITIDQSLVLILLDQNPDCCQREIAELVFKDMASMTRMIDLMVKKDFLRRGINEKDRRRFSLTVSSKGRRTINKLVPTVKQNRTTALKGLSNKEIAQMHNFLNKIIANCSA